MDTKEKKSQKTKFHFSLLAPRFLLNKKGQVAIILILVAAAGLIFYAITLNLGQMSQTKALVTIASNTAASQLASQMASYGQAVAERELQGQFQTCKYSGVLRAIIMAVVLAGIAFFTGGFGAMALASWLGASATTAAVIGTIVGGLGMLPLTLQVSVIEPGLTKRWNNQYQALETAQDLYTEQGIATGLQGVVTDRVRVPDFFDEDQDQVWGLDGGAPLDTISRFGIYYSERLKSIKPRDITDVEYFLDNLQRFLYEDPAVPVTVDNWALIDPGAGCPTSECDPCCVPAVDPLNPAVPLRPSECVGAIEAECAAASPYGAAYPWVYDPFYENPDNGIWSLREQLGRDDEHQLFSKNSLDPNGPQAPTGALPPPLPPDNFLIQDTTAYYTATDNRRGVFSYFYKLADWGIDLTDLHIDPADPAFKSEHCYWFAGAYEPLCATPVLPAELQSSPLNLPIAPSTLTINTNPYVDSLNDNPGSGNPPLAPDKVGSLGLVDPLRAIVADQAFCAERILTQVAPPLQGFWKRGGDRFCSVAPNPADPPPWPYSENCPKEAVCADPMGLGCVCEDPGVAPPQNWSDDALDDIVYGVQNFIIEAEEVLTIGNYAQIAGQFENWYPDIAQWIEPGTGAEPTGSNATPNGTSGNICYGGPDGTLCRAEDGKLVMMLKMIREMKQRLERLRDTSYAGAPGVCDEVWCVPGSGCPGGGDAPGAIGPNNFGPESDTFNVNGGNMEDVVACLDWNVNDRATTTSSLPVTAVGNFEKFRECDNACRDVRNDVNLARRAVDADDLCSALPRSLVPGFDALPFVRPTPLLLMCANNCNTCVTGCAGNAVCEAACSCGGCACSDAGCLSTQTVNAKGSCNDTGAGGFITLLQESIPEAQNQVSKFDQRLTFLRNRLNETNNTIGILDNAGIKFNEFLACPAGPACQLIQARINYMDEVAGLPYQAVYGWQDEPTPDTPTGRWHIVKVDARVPRKCEKTCGVGVDATGGDLLGLPDPPNFPWVRTYNKGFMKMRRCYEMTDTDGMVKVRVTRFDESKGSSILFPNGVPLWEFRYAHPDRPIPDVDIPACLATCAGDPDCEANCWSSNPYNLLGLDSSCRSSMVLDPPGLPPGAGTDVYRGAFIMNKRLIPNLDPQCVANCGGNSACVAACGGNLDCWDRVLNILTRGVTTDTCAKYYWHDGSRSGMGFKFVPCPNF